MDLIKKNIHMNGLKCKSNIQLTLDDDFNVPDVKPDIEKIMKEQGTIILSEVTPLNGKLRVKGALQFRILYMTTESERPVHSITGEIPFEELVNMDGLTGNDEVSVQSELEDLNTSLINSRKISVKSILSIRCCVNEIFDEETAVDVDDNHTLQLNHKKMQVTQLVVNKKDTLRLNEDARIPLGKSNVFEILYDDVKLQGVETRVLEDKINIKGDLVIFILYAGDDDSSALQYFETELPFHNVLDCSGCREDMIPDIHVKIQKKDLQMKPDEDGEERLINCEVVLELDLKIYEEEEIQVLSDLYSTLQEVIPERKEAVYRHLIMKNNSKVRVTDRINISAGEPKILQICNSTGALRLDEQRKVENGLEVEGVIEVQILYITEDDKKPLGAAKGVVPFSQLVEIRSMDDSHLIELTPQLEQMSVMMLDGEEVEVKAGISLDLVVFEQIKEENIVNLDVKEFDLQELQEKPSMVGYVVKKGDTLWDIAKQFYTTMDEIKELNELEGDRLSPGEKLLLVKKVEEV